MKGLRFLIFPIISSVLINACSPLYTCGDPIPEKKISGSNRLKSVVLERDELCALSNSNEKEIAELNNNLRGITAKYGELVTSNNELQGKYEDLINESLSQTDQFNKAINAKSEELNSKEKLLSEREKTLKDMQMIIARQDSVTKKLNDILRNALLGFNADELSVEIRSGKVYVSMTDKLLFKSGSVSVESKGKEALKLLADVLGKNSDIDILIEGHTDNVPIKTAVYKDNWDLSVGRATSIVRILANDYKISPTRFTASGKGEYYPRADNISEEGRARNRRTEIILSPKLDELMQILNKS